MNLANATKKCSKCGVQKPVSAFHRQPKGPMGLRSACVGCAKAARAGRTEAERHARRDYYERTKEQKQRYYQLVAKTNKSRHDAKYRQVHKDKVAANAAKRRADKLLATPQWADPEAIREIYELAREFAEEGIDVHVDHIVPLRGRSVCGLHVEQNLRVCLATVNRQKSNRNWSVYQ